MWATTKKRPCPPSGRTERLATRREGKTVSFMVVFVEQAAGKWGVPQPSNTTERTLGRMDFMNFDFSSGKTWRLSFMCSYWNAFPESGV